MDGSQPGRQLSGLAEIAQEPCGERRRALLREATDVFFAPRPPPQDLLDRFAAAVAQLADLVETEVRAELAVRLAHTPTIPHHLLKRLISDDDERVASPLLVNSPALTAEDLLDTASTGKQFHLRAVSSRRDLTAEISDKIVERADDCTLGVLTANDKAPLSRSACEKIISRAEANPTLHEALISRESLPLDVLNSMFTLVEKRLRDRIIQRNIKVPSEVLQDALKHVCVRVGIDQGALPEDYIVSKQYVERLQAAGPISPVTLLRFAKEGQLTRLIIAVSTASGVDEMTLFRLIRRKDLGAFVLTCRAAGYEDHVLLRLTRSLMPDCDPAEQIESVRDVSTGVASRVVRFWRMRQEAEAG